MTQVRKITEFPWAALDRTERALERSVKAVRSALERAANLGNLASALGALVGSPLEIVVRGVDRQPPRAGVVCIGLDLQTGGFPCVVELEPALCAALLSGLLRRRVPIVASDANFDRTLLGALSALVIEAARASGAELALVASPPSVSGECVVVHTSVIVMGRPYVAELRAFGHVRSAPPPTAQTLMAALGELELALPLVVASCLATPRLLSELAVGAAFCADGFGIDASGRGRAWLVAGNSESGFEVMLGPGGEIVLGAAARVALAPAEATTMQSDEAEPPTLAQAVLDAPLLVRIELGAVSMKAREWAALKAGDVIESGRRIAEPVVLRASGRVLAHGELVNLAGELGVRILEVLPES